MDRRGRKKGCKQWNVGLTKETDERVKKSAEKINKKLTKAYDKAVAMMKQGYNRHEIMKKCGICRATYFNYKSKYVKSKDTKDL